MTVNRGLYVPIDTGNVGTTELEARLADGGLFESNDGVNARSGVLSRVATATAAIVTGTSGMSYSLAGGLTFVVNRSSGEGTYRFSTTGATTVATTAAPVANSRIDVLWVKQNDQSKGDANNLATFGVTNGTAAATPAAPSIPAGALELARATITSSTTRTDAASITQTFRHTSLRGTPTLIRSSAERAEITAPRLYQRIHRPDRGGVIEEWDGSAWNVPPGPRVIPGAARIGNSATLASGSGPQAIVQAGSAVVNLNSTGYANVNFPSPFPNGVLAVVLTNGDSTASGRDKHVTLTATGNSSLALFHFSVTDGNGVGYGNQQFRVEFVAVGW